MPLTATLPLVSELPSGLRAYLLTWCIWRAKELGAQFLARQHRAGKQACKMIGRVNNQIVSRRGQFLLPIEVPANQPPGVAPGELL